MSDIPGIDQTGVSICTLRQLSHSLSPDPSWSPHVDHLAIPNDQGRLSDAPPQTRPKPTPAKTKFELGRLLPLPLAEPLAKLPWPAQCSHSARTQLCPGVTETGSIAKTLTFCSDCIVRVPAWFTRHGGILSPERSSSVNQSLIRKVGQSVDQSISNQQSRRTAVAQSSAGRPSRVACRENGRRCQPAGLPGMGFTQAALIIRL